jgi:CelD/BcsL family acetyltransferase involved in cellulose biosynthesis
MFTQEYQSIAATALRVDVMTTIADFERCRSNWEMLYQADRYAQVFLTWTWLREQIAIQHQQLQILVAFQGNQPIGVLPLRWGRPNRFSLPLERQLCMVGNPQADYTGMLCLPEAETQVIEAFANYLRAQADWGVMQLRDVIDPRCATLIELLSNAPGYDLYRYRGAICPYIDLPASWETYLTENVSTKQRKNLRKALKTLEEDPSVTIGQTTPDRFESDFADFVQVYQLRWGKLSRHKRQQMADLARSGINHGIIRMYIFRQGAQVVAGEMLFFDAKNKSLCGYQRGYDPQFKKLSPGNAAVAYVIRQAISDGLVRFDFLRGDEGYKSKFGTRDRWTEHFLVARSRRSRMLRKAVFSVFGGR